ncbi:LytTR family DNA-binding domain-containing protein [Massilia sp. TS11]|uniref:LytTR family DNA-binding domain-containing protein n=1 Tax=Massilia sp. TS11 TaxID=2908003 RepID=UPI001EDC00B7|nr:LytTR family DNA-binding domain-containing protein [Massilia sp. TS11]MCG2583606.1 LytTR family transcriptional regulator [Massilia sp. TS11]
MPFALREMRWLRQGLLVLALGLLFAAFGPFGTYADLGWEARLGYWVGLMLLAWGASVLVAQALAPLALAPWLRFALVCLLAALPVTLAVAWVEALLRLRQAVPPRVMPRVYVSVVGVELLLLALLTRLRWDLGPLLLARTAAPAPTPAAADASAVEAAPAPFLARIPPHLGSELLALEAEDHYLRVHTARGSDLILMRLGDALRELPPALGLQVHRSWWVAHAAVRAQRRVGGKWVLELAGGLQVPVSRSWQAAVRAANWPAAA